MSEAVARRGPKVAVGALVIVAGLVAASVMWIASGERRSGAVEDLARAPVGCDTTLDFVEPGSYLVFIETSGELAEVRGDCAASGVFDVGSTVPDAEITVVDPDGVIIDLESDVDDVTYDDAGFVGAAAFSLDIAEADDHVIRVESPGDEAFVVAIGGDPSDGVLELRIGAFAVGLLAVLLGGVLMVLGMRRGGADQLAPQWSGQTPTGRPELFTPGRAPSGPPTYGPPPTRPPTSPPVRPADWAPDPGWQGSRPPLDAAGAPSPPPQPPPPPPPLSRDGSRSAPNGPPPIPGEPVWGPSSASPPAPSSSAPPLDRGAPADPDQWASPEVGDSIESRDARQSTDDPASPQPPA